MLFSQKWQSSSFHHSDCSDNTSKTSSIQSCLYIVSCFQCSLSDIVSIHTRTIWHQTTTWRSWVHTHWPFSLPLGTSGDPSPPNGRAWTLCWVCHIGSHNGGQQPSVPKRTLLSAQKATHGRQLEWKRNITTRDTNK